MRNGFRSILLVVLALSSAALAAVEREPFTKERFEALQAEEALILLDVWAKWCPTCARQEKILARYQEERPESELKILVIDFDDQKEWVRHFRAPRQSTFLLYRGNEQLWFSVAETDPDKIFSRLDAAAQ
ncbi:thioredoxin family protein [Chromatocurvus halotolerans]|uniref:Thioredoxin n=1 Tax=Chromatocurvus halotolerans TaxID=1132028 RepID=A0A4R2L2B5_9GAMM|nr:thioredoxin family protein [Chromatocurvus halotolerans]TCO77896.1 thioredoxin [Chromatocurvus halotolerans]